MARKVRPEGKTLTAQPGKSDPLEEHVRVLKADLQSAHRELESFCYSVSHDLRAPLRCIDGFSHALLHEFGDKLDPGAREYLQRILDSAKKMARLIDELLALSRIQRADLVSEDFNLADVAGQIVTRLRKVEPSRNVQFRTVDSIPVRGDRALIATMLEKFLENAWKFTSKADTPLIEFSEIGNGSERIFLVRDNGVGFDPAYASKLFKAFQRLHPHTDFPGVGMGLALARAVILRHGGRTWAESEKDNGAAFFFTLGGPSKGGNSEGPASGKGERSK